ncbi:MAG: trypsin-like peptidase domain-containing protein [Flavobacteriaceae bacterium]|nr:trypsin-like peptidase domain-containing protein [Flavobacteriaceae bacterium]
MKKVVSIILCSALGGVLTLGGYKIFFEKPQNKVVTTTQPVKMINTSYTGSDGKAMEETDFTIAAKKTLDVVVHVKNISTQTVRDPFAEFFYGQNYGSRQYQRGTMGSGVIISADGYIVTNNHVIKDATDLEITLNNKKVYKAKLVGTDSSTDIALLKIDAEDLPHITFADSNNVKIGEWVLAVGNPYNLTSTVTAGIISAKGRDLEGNNNIESFIQTDAAVNPGNSGGALVNVRGELIGINTAITSKTGSFIGYSFAVPSNIARKVVEDLMEYGNVQNAVLGVKGGELNQKVAENLGIEDTEGFYVSEVTENSGAEKAGLKEKDIIIGIDNVKISSFSDLAGVMKSKRPNDSVRVVYMRDGEQKTTQVVLSKNEIKSVNSLGLSLENLSKKQCKKLGISNGVRIAEITNKELLYYGVKKGYIITNINGKPIKNTNDVTTQMQGRGNGQMFRIEMLNLDGEVERYIFR